MCNDQVPPPAHREESQAFLCTLLTQQCSTQLYTCLLRHHIQCAESAHCRSCVVSSTHSLWVQPPLSEPGVVYAKPNSGGQVGRSTWPGPPPSRERTLISNTSFPTSWPKPTLSLFLSLHSTGSAVRYNAQYGAQLITINSTVATFRFFSIGGANAYSGFQVRYSRLLPPFG